MRRCSFAVVVVLAAACGRLGFDPATERGPQVADGGDPTESGVVPEALACADLQLGSALGSAVATGTTVGRGNRNHVCDGDGPDVTYGWTAPETGSYQIDLCNSDLEFDTTLLIRDGSCSGAVLACDDDGCGFNGSRVRVQLVAGQSIAIIVDGFSEEDEGLYQLAITRR